MRRSLPTSRSAATGARIIRTFAPRWPLSSSGTDVNGARAGICLRSALILVRIDPRSCSERSQWSFQFGFFGGRTVNSPSGIGAPRRAASSKPSCGARKPNGNFRSRSASSWPKSISYAEADTALNELSAQPFGRLSAKACFTTLRYKAARLPFWKSWTRRPLAASQHCLSRRAVRIACPRQFANLDGVLTLHEAHLKRY